MLKIAEMVREEVMGDEAAGIALDRGLLNLRAYARDIHAQIEAKTKKRVKLGSIVAALSRMGKQGGVSVVPEVTITDMTIKAPLVELIFDKNEKVIAGLREFYRGNTVGPTEFLAVTQGTAEVNVIVSEKEREAVEAMGKKPKAVIDNLVGLSVRFSAEYVSVPNVIYSLIKKLAVRRINIVEIVSTYTELTFVIDRKDLTQALEGLAR